ncbi:Maf family nucleotide pyrophosphatase [Polaribacter uvawellassae]|uniref:Maf family nucleotide pyrophosphatase n=1 Tax=Polaribacter uvawellassae TaxID=3133495 RepID=UPI0032195CAC
MLKEKLSNYNIILASKSPRRQQFLKDLDIPFTIQLKEIEELYPPQLQGTEITDYLADLKSKPFTNLKEKDVLITSDTIVWLNNKALGKPKDKNDAIRILKEISGKMHQVITSVSLKGNNFQTIFNDTTNVYFKELTDDEIAYYVEQHQPYDKAGSYGIQEWIGFIGIERIEGSYFNVMGLPVQKLYKELIKM